MKPAIIVAFAVVVAALRVGLRRRRRSPGRRRTGFVVAPLTSEVGLVAVREMRERFRGKIFRLGTLLILVVVAAAIVIPTFSSGKASSRRIGVVGTLSAPMRQTVESLAKSIDTTVHFVSEPNAKVARSALRAGRIDVAIVDESKLLVDKPVGPTDTSGVTQLAKDLGATRAVEAAHLSPSQASELASATALPVKSLQAHAIKAVTYSTSLIGLILIFVMLSQYNGWTMIGVMEEKSSRVVEVLLSTMRPIQLLTGKVLGIGMVAFAQASLIVVFALILAQSVGSGLLHGTAPLVIASTLLWLVLGYAFYCWVYAAAGSMAERQDQVQSLALPLSLPMIFGYVMGLTAEGSASASPFFKVLAYLPPTAPFDMPVLVGLGAVTWWEFLSSVIISIACTVAVARLAAGIYRRAILRTGGRVKLREMLSQGAR
jgi:ABC-2 type transport system permease protein